MRTEAGTQAAVVTTRLSPENDMGDTAAKVFSWIVLSVIAAAVSAFVISLAVNLLT